MLTLKIRVPYKIGKPEDILNQITEQLIQSESITYGLDDNTIVIKFGYHCQDIECDLRLLEIQGGE